MSGAIECCAGVVFENHQPQEVEINSTLMHVSAPATARRPKSGACIDLWADCGRWRLRLDAAQLKWLRTELAKLAPRMEVV